MIQNGKFVRFVDSNTRMVIEGLFGFVQNAVSSLALTGELKAISELWCCEDCDGSPSFEPIAHVQDGQIWPIHPVDPEGNQITPKRTLRTRNLTHVLKNYLPGSGWPDSQRCVRRQGRRAQRRFSKAIAREAMLDLE